MPPPITQCHQASQYWLPALCKWYLPQTHIFSLQYVNIMQENILKYFSLQYVNRISTQNIFRNAPGGWNVFKVLKWRGTLTWKSFLCLFVLNERPLLLFLGTHNILPRIFHYDFHKIFNQVILIFHNDFQHQVWIWVKSPWWAPLFDSTWQSDHTIALQRICTCEVPRQSWK